MQFARVIGTVVCTDKLEAFSGEKLLLLQPLDENGTEFGRQLVATDATNSAGPGEIVFYETGREAAIALHNTWNTSDATVMAIVDQVDIDSSRAPSPSAKKGRVKK